MLTKQAAKRLCRFMEYTSSSWRNAIYIDCGDCPHSAPTCSGYLLAADASGKPVLFPVNRLQELTNEEILKDECAGILSRQAFCQLYSKLLLWETDASEPCGIRQIFSSSFGPY